MSLSNLFKTCLPYGFKRLSDNSWAAFNREYKPLGFYTREDFNFETLPIGVPWAFTEPIIMSLVDGNEKSVKRDESGKITFFWLYNDDTNPANTSDKRKAEANFERYFAKIKKISNYRTPKNI